MKKVIYILSSISILVIAVYVISANTNNNRNKSLTVMDYVSINPQSDVTEIRVKKVVFDEPGFVVVRETLNGKPGQIVNSSKLLPTGVSKDISIPVSEPVPTNGISLNASGRPFTVKLVAVLYADNGDEAFNPSQDKPIYKNGKLLAVSIDTGLPVTSESVIPNSPNSTDSSSTQADVTIIYTDAGFDPVEVTINSGDTVEWVNQSSRPMWVASNAHPMHTDLPTFDQFTTSAVGETYQYTFENKGIWTYHDHVNAAREGVVIVK